MLDLTDDASESELAADAQMTPSDVIAVVQSLDTRGFVVQGSRGVNLTSEGKVVSRIVRSRPSDPFKTDGVNVIVSGDLDQSSGDMGSLDETLDARIKNL